jgi:hypothetical protein
MPVVSQVEFSLDGPEFRDGVPILKVTDALREFHSTVDKAYLSILAREKITRQDRSVYKLSATRVGIGSFYSDIQIVVPAAQFALSFLPAGIGPDHVWEVVKNAFTFLRTMAFWRKEGKDPKVEISPTGDASKLLAVGVNNSITVNHIVYNAATRSEGHVKSLAKLVDGEHITGLSALDEKKEGIRLLPPDNDLFNPATHMDDQPLELTAKIYRLDVESRSGRLRTLSGELETEHPFQIVGRQSLHPYVIALERPRSVLKVLREIVRHPTGLEIVHSYHVIEVVGSSR